MQGITAVVVERVRPRAAMVMVVQGPVRPVGYVHRHNTAQAERAVVRIVATNLLTVATQARQVRQVHHVHGNVMRGITAQTVPAVQR